MAYAIDTAATIADLEAAGVAPAHAKAIVHAINGAAGDPVSKDDFKDLRGEFKDLRGEFNELRGDFNALRGEFNELRGDFNALRGDFNELRDEVRSDIKALRSKSEGDIKALRDEFKATFATKADLEAMKSALTTRIVLAQIATAMLLFTMLKVFG